MINYQACAIQVAPLSPLATIPTRATPLSIGLDLYAAEEKSIQPNSSEVIRTDIQIRVPKGTYGRIAPRSGLAAKYNLFINGGVIDEDFCGNITVIVANLGKETYQVKIGNRIAQLICERAALPEVQVSDPITMDSIRGSSGLGSTGL